MERILPSDMKIIDSAESTADKLVFYLCHEHGAPPKPTPADPILKFFATDSVEKFERLGSRFLGRPVGNVELVDLGG
jgi:glutamate racemase